MSSILCSPHLATMHACILSGSRRKSICLACLSCAIAPLCTKLGSSTAVRQGMLLSILLSCACRGEARRVAREAWLQPAHHQGQRQRRCWPPAGTHGDPPARQGRRCAAVSPLSPVQEITME